jgi:hypothetical protein
VPLRREEQVLADGHGGPDPAALRYQCDAGAGDLVGAAAGQFASFEPYAAGGRPDQAHQGE